MRSFFPGAVAAWKSVPMGSVQVGSGCCEQNFRTGGALRRSYLVVGDVL